MAAGLGAGNQECIIEVADVCKVVAGPADAESWAPRAKVAVQQLFKRFGPVLDVKVCDSEAEDPVLQIRFANSKAAEASMLAAKQGFLAMGDSEVRLRQPASKESIWRSFAPPKRGKLDAGPPKKKLRPNERFAPPPIQVVFEEFEAEKEKEPPKPAPPPTAAPQPPPEPQGPQEPDRPTPETLISSDATDEDRAVAAGQADVALAMDSLLAQPFSQQKKALKALRLKWHPDKNPDSAAIATRVFQFVQAHDEWLAFHNLS